LAAAPAALGCSTRDGGAGSAREAAPARALASDPHVQGALERACYDCHSDRGAPAWYAKLAFSYWFAGSARKKLDFSAWQGYDASARAAQFRSIEKTVLDGEMPPWDYTLLLSSAKLAPDEKQALARWAAQQASAPTDTP
jgi:Haem-binding domain